MLRVTLAIIATFIFAVGSALAQETKHQAELTDAAVIALIIAGSIAAYKAMGKPCACPSDLMRNWPRVRREQRLV
jgi:hypothetical protein